ncbi:MAG TPA: rod shape-determining protein MreD [Gaiellales bacterium]|nr:rod shape-determining protein MreD [Gaiellales bacterium]
MSVGRIIGIAVVFVVALPLAVLLQLSVASDLSLVAGAPDFVLIVVAGLALARGPELGCLAGFAAGLSLDVLAEHALGRDALVYCVAGYCLGLAGEKLRPPAPVRSLLLIALATALVRIAEGGTAFLLGSDGALGHAFGVKLIAAPAASVLFAIPLLALLRRVLGVKAPPRRQFPVPDAVPEEADVPALV